MATSVSSIYLILIEFHQMHCIWTNWCMLKIYFFILSYWRQLIILPRIIYWHVVNIEDANHLFVRITPLYELWEMFSSIRFQFYTLNSSRELKSQPRFSDHIMYLFVCLCVVSVRPSVNISTLGFFFIQLGTKLWRWRSFKLVQMKSYSLFKGKIIYNNY